MENLNNKVQLTGFIGNHVPLIDTSRTKIATVSVAGNSYSRKEGKNVKYTVWHKLVGFNDAAYEMAGLRKGDRVLVHGYLKDASYTKDHKTISKIELV